MDPLTPDQIDAESRKYGPQGVMILQLLTGRWAVYDRTFALQAVVNEFAEIEAVVKRIKPPPPQPAYEAPRKASSPALSSLRAKLKDLDL